MPSAPPEPRSRIRSNPRADGDTATSVLVIPPYAGALLLAAPPPTGVPPRRNVTCSRKQGRSRPRAGAVAFVQRFDSGHRVNLHFHVLWTDGVLEHQLREGLVEFCEHDELTDADVAKLVRTVRDRVLRYVRRLGKLPAAGEDAVEATDGSDGLLVELAAASVQCRSANEPGNVTSVWAEDAERAVREGTAVRGGGRVFAARGGAGGGPRS